VSKADPIDLAALIGRTPHKADASLVASLVVGKTVLITGAAGSIGSAIAEIVATVQHDHLARGVGGSRLVCVDRDECRQFLLARRLAHLAPLARVELPIVDVSDREAITRCIAGQRPDVVIHAAAHKHVPLMEAQPGAAIVNNVAGTRNVVDAAAAARVGRLVYISTDKAVEPRSVMGATKRAGELYVAAHGGGVRRSIVRFGNVLASSCSVLAIWHEQVAAGEPITLTDPAMSRYFMTIPEAAALSMAAGAMTEGPDAETYVLDMGEPVNMGDLARRYLRAVGCPETAVRVVGARPGERLEERLTGEGESAEPTRHAGVLRVTGAVPAAPVADEVVEMERLARAGRVDEALALLWSVVGQGVACGC